MSTEVYFAQRRATSGGGLLEKVEQLFEAAGLSSAIAPGDRVALKTHFGERGNTTYLRPEFARRLVKRLVGLGAHPFVTDTNARASESRSDALGHLAVAAEHGYTRETLGAPVLIADGLDGRAGVAIETRGGRLEVAEAIAGADALIVLNHVTFHPEAGFCGALYHLGMGSLTRQAKLELVAAEALVGAGGLVTGHLPVDRLAEVVSAVAGSKRGKVLYCNVLLDVTPDPDGVGWSDAAVVPDVGVFVARDPVALDQATADFLNMQTGLPGTRLDLPAAPDKIKALYPHIDWAALVKAAEKARLGSRDYELLIS